MIQMMKRREDGRIKKGKKAEDRQQGCKERQREKEEKKDKLEKRKRFLFKY